MTRLKYTFKTDTLFKMLFVKYPELLKELVANLLEIPSGSIGQFTIRNPEMPPENLEDKFCRLDINMTVNGQRVDLEVQVCHWKLSAIRCCQIKWHFISMNFPNCRSSRAG